MSWQRLIRFQDEQGATRFGEPLIQNGEELMELFEKGELHATALEGIDPFALKTRGSKVHVKKILGILTPEDVPSIRCIGLNYMKHSTPPISTLCRCRIAKTVFAVQEGGRTPPPKPSIFLKPRTSIAGFDEDIPVPKICQDDQCDYEGELSVVIGKTGKNIAPDDVLDHVAGYCSSNDVSSRKWQRNPELAGGVPQWCFSKGFDKYAPLGPMLVSPKVVGDAGSLQIQTRVNDELRQDSNTNDMLFNIKTIVSFLSQGTTLEKGTVIMTGTPSGVAFGMKPKPVWLKDGDIVECRVEELGSTRNKIIFE